MKIEQLVHLHTRYDFDSAYIFRSHSKDIFHGTGKVNKHYCIFVSATARTQSRRYDIIYNKRKVAARAGYSRPGFYHIDFWTATATEILMEIFSFQHINTWPAERVDYYLFPPLKQQATFFF